MLNFRSRLEGEPLESIPPLPPFPPLEPVQAAVGLRNIDAAFDEFSPPGVGIGGGRGGLNAFTISDATEAGVEKFSLTPGYLEVNIGGLSTFLTPTMDGSPITDAPPPTLNAVSGDVYLKITVDVLGVPTAAEVGNAATMPTDTINTKYVRIGVIDVGPDIVDVTEQIITSDIFYNASPKRPYQATTGLNGDDVVLTEIAYGLIMLPLEMDPEAFVLAATSSTGDAKTHAWIKVEWDESYLVTAATTTFGTAWPSPAYSVPGKYINIPVAYVDAGALVQVRTGNVMLHVTAVTGGIILMPVS